MDWISLAACLPLSVYYTFAWRKYSDKDYLWLSRIGFFVVFLLVTRLFFINLFPENIKTIVRILVLSSWIFLLYAFVQEILRKKK
jgi:hypothetical protein